MKMETITLDLELARSIAKDTANRQMKKSGREKWNKQDYKLAVKTLNTLWPLDKPFK